MGQIYCSDNHSVTSGYITVTWSIFFWRRRSSNNSRKNSNIIKHNGFQCLGGIFHTSVSIRFQVVSDSLPNFYKYFETTWKCMTAQMTRQINVSACWHGVAIQRCVHFEMRPFRIVAIIVCVRSGFWSFQRCIIKEYGSFGLGAFRSVAVMTYPWYHCLK